MNPVYRCPDCGGFNVQELCLTWVNANTGVAEDPSGIAEAYPDVYWCLDCEAHQSELIREDHPRPIRTGT